MVNENYEVMLIKPPNTYNIDPKEQQPLGILYIASILRNNGYDIGFKDFSDKSLKYVLENEVPKLNSEVYMLTATFLDLEISTILAKSIKHHHGNSLIGIGGVGVTTAPNLIDMDVFDFKVLGEGKKSVLNVMTDIYSSNLKKTYSLSPLTNSEIDSLPNPARDILDYQGGKIFNFGKEYYPSQSTGILTSRGCPYTCSFCSSENIWKRKVRLRSIDSVIEEIEEVIKRFKVYNFKIQDELFTLKEDRVLHFSERMERLNKKYKNRISWRAYGVRVDRITRNELEHMKRGGCKEIDFAPESGDQYILDLMNKGITVEQSIEAFRLAREVRIDTRAFMMVGLPGTNEETANKDISFLEKAKPNAVNLSIFTPYPGSDIYNNPEKYLVSFEKPRNPHELYKFRKFNMHLFSRDPNKSRNSVIKPLNIDMKTFEEQKKIVINYVLTSNLLSNNFTNNKK